MRFRYFLTAFAVLAIGGCSDSSSPGADDAELRVVHATASLGSVDVLVDGEPVLSGVSFGASRGVQVPSGSHQLTFRSGGTVLGEITANLTTEHVNAIVVANGAPQLSGTVIPDTGAVAVARANLRLVNVVGTNLSAPTDLQVLINFPGVSADSAARIGMDAKVASYSSLLYFDPGHFRLRYVPAGTNTVLAEAEFDIGVGQVRVAVLQRDANGQYRLSIAAE
jgi:hypothetical protein